MPSCAFRISHLPSRSLSRLRGAERRAQTTRTIRETEAEAVAFVVSHAIGLDGEEASTSYIQVWNGDKQTLTESLQLIQAKAAQVLASISPGD